MSSPPVTGDLFEPAPVVPPARGPGAALPAGGPRRAGRELWLCLDLPGLPLAAVAPPSGAADAAAGAGRPAPRAVVEGEGAQQRVIACEAAAAARGIAPGLGAGAALALVPALELLRRQPHAEAALLERIARWATQFTPVVSPEPPAALLLELRGSLGLFGGAAALRQRLLDELAARGLPARAAFAPTPRAALWLARAGVAAGEDGAVHLPAVAGRLPLTCLGWPEPVLQRLVATGVRNVADLLRLPRDGFARRFGPDLLAELDEAGGLRAQPRRRQVAPERFDERLDLPAECASTAALRPACDHLLGRLGAFLRVRVAGLGGFAVELRHRDAPATRLVIGLARPSGDVAQLRLLLGERLARTPLPAPVVALRLRSSAVTPLELRAPGLFGRHGNGGDPAAAARLLERLRARLGHAAVFSVDCVPDHRPEAAWRAAEPALQDAALMLPRRGRDPARPPRRSPGRDRDTRSLQGGSGHLARAPEASCAALRPLWLLATPQPLRARDGVPLYERAPLALVAGPERIESGWWDGRDVRRDYYVACAASGARLWVYRARERDGGWWLHGVFG